MAKIYNPQTIKRILDDAGIQTSQEDAPTQLASKVVPVLISNPKPSQYFVEGRIQLATGSSTLFTTPSDKDFYLTSAQMGFTKDVVCDSATGSYALFVRIGGVSKSILRLPIFTLVLERGETAIGLTEPIKLDRNSTIIIDGTFTAGDCIRSGTITGYTL